MLSTLTYIGFPFIFLTIVIVDVCQLALLFFNLVLGSFFHYGVAFLLFSCSFRYFELKLVSLGVHRYLGMENCVMSYHPSCIGSIGIVGNKGPPNLQMYGWYIDCENSSCPFVELSLEGVIEDHIARNPNSCQPLVAIAKFIKATKHNWMKMAEERRGSHAM